MRGNLVRSALLNEKVKKTLVNKVDLTVTVFNRPAAGRRVTLKRDFSERNMGQGPAAKRRDSTGAQGRLVPSSVALNALLWVPLL